MRKKACNGSYSAIMEGENKILNEEKRGEARTRSMRNLRDLRAKNEFLTVAFNDGNFADGRRHVPFVAKMDFNDFANCWKEKFSFVLVSPFY